MQIEQLIDSIQKRPGMFVEGKRVDYIYYLLSGYCGANNKLLHEDDMNQSFSCWFGKWLWQWIEENVDAEYTPRTMLWYDDIKWLAKDGQEEFTLFFDLCKLFFEDYKNKTGYFSWRNQQEEK